MAKKPWVRSAALAFPKVPKTRPCRRKSWFAFQASCLRVLYRSMSPSSPGVFHEISEGFVPAVEIPVSTGLLPVRTIGFLESAAHGLLGGFQFRIHARRRGGGHGASQGHGLFGT